MNHQGASELVITPGQAGDETADIRARHARRGLLAYLAIVLPLSAVLQGIIVTTGQFIPYVLIMMMVPALASVLVRLGRHEGFTDVSFRFGGRRTWWTMLFVWLGPVGIGLVAYGIAWLTGLATFSPPDGIAPNPIAALGIQLLSALTLGTLTTLVFAAGEEIGWRGYMLTRLIDGRVPFPILASGVIWGLWHSPLVLSGQYAAGSNPLLSMPIFLVTIVSAGCIYAWVRLSTGSIWPAVVMHSAWNSVIQGPFDSSTRGEDALLWTGESGILVAAVLLTLAFAVSRVPYTMFRATPRETVPAAEPAVNQKAA